jgi:CheY-like chemotaxis protein
MPIVAIMNGSFCGAEEIAGRVAKEVGLSRIEERLLDHAAARFSVARERLSRTLAGPPPFFDSFTRERERNRIWLASSLAELLQADNALVVGPAALLVPKTLPHAVRVLVIAKFEHRLAEALKTGLSRREAQRLIHREDRERAEWARFLLDRDPYDETLYDVVEPTDHVSTDEAVAEIIAVCRSPALGSADASACAARDFLLASQVHLALIDRGRTVEVTSVNGDVTVSVQKYTSRLDPLKERLSKLAAAVPGVVSVKVVPGTGFIPPSLLRAPDVTTPTRVLLVDDERDFVHTLSERLKTRSLESAVVYDGEEALEFIEREEPEVMVLDLKMPGIDGIEVLRRVKKEHPAIEVIILTGHGSDREEEMARDLGAFAYLKKPVDIDLLSRTMREAYDRIRRRRI